MLQILNITENILKEAQENLPQNYQAGLKIKTNYKESIVGRYLIYKNTGYLPQTNINGVPIFEKNNFWSLSHKENLVFIGYDTKEIGVDIEIVKPRSEEIFSLHSKEEYNLLENKNLIQFYMLWTLKESIIKVFLSSIDFIEEIDIESVTQETKAIDSLPFEYHLEGIFKGQGWKGSIGTKDNLIYSFCQKI